eukprot:TRINITY_DN20552_c0_g1_i2.p1 TRINITY_DN20552_c0_g1~~TRINITY_DN20552_c0_g1_i2.p1  ORF type:complete len:548 (+),score=175.64 TRINITY_DN20552_c0_g1_i2:75-1718(+)
MGDVEEDEDEVVEEIDVYLSPQLAGHLHLWQFPTLPPGSHYLDGVHEVAVRVAPTRFEAATTAGDQRLRMVSTQPRAPRVCSDQPTARLMAATLRRGDAAAVLSLTPIRGVHQFRPSFDTAAAGRPLAVLQVSHSDAAVDEVAARLLPEPQHLLQDLAPDVSWSPPERAAEPSSAGEPLEEQVREALEGLQVATLGSLRGLLTGEQPDDDTLIRHLTVWGVLIHGLWVARVQPGLQGALAIAREWILLRMWEGTGCAPGKAAVVRKDIMAEPFALPVDASAVREVLEGLAELQDLSAASASPPPPAVRRRRVEGACAPEDLLRLRRRAECRLWQCIESGQFVAQAEHDLLAVDQRLAELCPPARVWTLKRGGCDDDFSRRFPITALHQHQSWEAAAERIRHAVSCSAGDAATALAPRPGDDAETEVLREWLQRNLEPRGVVNRALLDAKFREFCQGRRASVPFDVYQKTRDAMTVPFGDAALALREPPAGMPRAAARFRWAYIECFNERPRWRKKDIERRVCGMLRSHRVLSRPPTSAEDGRGCEGA